MTAIVTDTSHQPFKGHFYKGKPKHGNNASTAPVHVHTSHTPPTPAQLKYINGLQKKTGIQFIGTSKQEASEYISKMVKLVERKQQKNGFRT